MSRSRPFLRLILRRPGVRRAVAVATALAALALLPGVLRLQTDNSPRSFFVDGSPGVADYERFGEVFGSDLSLRVVVDGPGVFTSEGLRALGRLEDELSRLGGVLRTSGLARHHRRFGWPPNDAEAFRQRAMADDLDRAAGWIDAEGSLATILLQIHEKHRAAERDALVEQIEDIARGVEAESGAEAEAQGLRVRVLGLPVLNRDLDRSSAEIEQRYLPLLVVFAVALLLVFVRDPLELPAPLLFVALCEILALGFLAASGQRMNLVLAVLPPLIFVIALATALHLLLRLRQLGGDSRLERAEMVEELFAEKAWAVFWTGITTAVGFASLALSPVRPVHSLGLWAAIGLLLLTVAAFISLPVLFASLGRRRKDETLSLDETRSEHEERSRALGRRWAAWSVENRNAVLGTALALMVLALVGLPRLRLESNALRYLAPDHPLRAGIEDLETRGVGVAALEVWVRLDDSGGGAPAPFVSALEIDRLADLTGDLEDDPQVLGALSAGDVLRDALRYVPATPGSAAVRPQMVLDGLRADDEDREVLAALLAESGRSARATVFVPTLGAEDTASLVERVRAAAEARFPEGEVVVTGQVPLLLEAQRHLISTLVWSLVVTLLAVAVVLRLLLPSNRLALLALLPNLWPVAGVFGVMGWFGVPLDIATVMVAAVVLGLAVDDTIHTLGHFRRLAPRHGARRAVVETLGVTAPAYLLTGVILLAGFGVCALSDFAPIARFGGLSAVGIALAVLGDLVLLPALLGLTPDEVVRRLPVRD